MKNQKTKCKCCGLIGCEEHNELNQKTLSDKIYNYGKGWIDFLKVEDVKTFIKKLKEDFKRAKQMSSDVAILLLRDRLGEELTR